MLVKAEVNPTVGPVHTACVCTCTQKSIYTSGSNTAPLYTGLAVVLLFRSCLRLWISATQKGVREIALCLAQQHLTSPETMYQWKYPIDQFMSIGQYLCFTEMSLIQFNQPVGLYSVLKDLVFFSSSNGPSMKTAERGSIRGIKWHISFTYS